MQFSENEFFYISSLNFDAIELKFGHNVQKNKVKKNLGADFWFFDSFSVFRAILRNFQNYCATLPEKQGMSEKIKNPLPNSSSPYLAKNTQIFDRFGENVNFSRFSNIFSMVPTVLVIFSIIIDIVLVNVWHKKRKNWPIWTLNFLIKVENAPNSTIHISGTVDYFAARFAELEPYWKVLSYKIDLFFWPWTPLSP